MTTLYKKICINKYQTATELNANDNHLFAILFHLSGYTALHEACVLGQEKVVQKLIERGADMSSQQLDGHTPLMVRLIYNLQIYFNL